MRNPFASLAAWAGRLDTCLRVTAFGAEEVTSSYHEPLPSPDRLGCCDLDGLPLEDPLHDRRYRRRKVPQAAVDLAAVRGWR